MNRFESTPPSLNSGSPIGQCSVVTTSGPFKPVVAEELRKGFETDPVFREFLKRANDSEKNACDQWMQELTGVINLKMAEAPGHMTGCELLFRFRKTYGGVHHMAQATVWRDTDGRFRMGFAHQESIRESEKRYRGRVFDTFDTRLYMNGRNPPVLDSLLKQGLPDVKVLPCAMPENIGLALWLSDERCEHPYGFDGAEDAAGFHALTCFSITSAVHQAVHGNDTGVDTSPTVPDGFRRAIRAYFGEQALERYRYFEHKGQRFDIDNLPKETMVKGFMALGTTWGNAENWDVRPCSEREPTPHF